MCIYVYIWPFTPCRNTMQAIQKKSKPLVLCIGLPEMQVSFLVVVLTVLFFALVAPKVVTQQCFGCCWGVLQQHQCSPKFQPQPLTPRPVVWEWERSWEVTVWTVEPNWSKGYSIQYCVCSAIKANKEEKRGVFVFYEFVFWSKHCVDWSLAFLELAIHTFLLSGSRVGFFNLFSLLLHSQPFLLLG